MCRILGAVRPHQVEREAVRAGAVVVQRFAEHAKTVVPRAAGFRAPRRNVFLICLGFVIRAGRVVLGKLDACRNPNGPSLTFECTRPVSRFTFQPTRTSTASMSSPTSGSMSRMQCRSPSLGPTLRHQERHRESLKFWWSERANSSAQTGASPAGSRRWGSRWSAEPDGEELRPPTDGRDRLLARSPVPGSGSREGDASCHLARRF